jgi:hypothetical protein
VNNNKPANNLKKVLHDQAKNKQEPAEELSEGSAANKKNDDHTEKPKVDPGIDYMKWSD